MKKCHILIGLIFFAFGLFPGCSDKAQEERRYEIKAYGLAELMVSQAHACVSQSKAYQAVWEYAKVSEMDFKTAADNPTSPLMASA